jgi:HSP20 family protein
MAIGDWTFSPWTDFEREFDRLRRQMDTVFGRVGISAGARFPALNLYDQGEEVLVAVEAPGVRKEDLDIQLRESVLTVEAKRPAPDFQGANVLRDEAVYGEFSRSLRIPSKVQADKIEAQYKNGILMVRMPKSEAAKPKQIAINA